ncbi:hypothetical protein MRQ36_08485 [Micromonospora sp. R77]|uniref:hypothetical protein n=1 Tax=Micromonospora sp. R77 TaxID=2925836 RepID=UPI001F6079F8|nr:hypothetical protein [Micromonospora sp. R77]MCI4062601.1 hypothetical protein [Micromonospora sp. R77]
MKKTLIRAATASALGVAIGLIAIPTAAQAATTKCGYDGYDRACATNNDNGTSSYEVCDNEDDGRSVTGFFVMSNGNQYIITDLYGGACKTGTATIKVHYFTMQENLGTKIPNVYMY